MAPQQIKINGTTHNIAYGQTKVNGTTHDLAYGQTKVNGTSHYITFSSPDPPNSTAYLYNDGSFLMTNGINNPSPPGVSLVNQYTNFVNAYYSTNNAQPWKAEMNSIKSVIFSGSVTPNTTRFWFYYAKNLNSFYWDSFNFSQVTDMRSMFDSCNNATFTEIRTGNNVTNMEYAFENCQNITAQPVCGPNVKNLIYTYSNCLRLQGSPVCGDKVTSLYNTYFNCRNLTGSAACGNNVTSMHGTYRNCYNLKYAVCGPNVTSMVNTYTYCNNLQTAICGDKVTNMYQTYFGCTNLTSATIGANVTHAAFAFQNCPKLQSVHIYSNNITNMQNAFWVANASLLPTANNTKLNIKASYGTTTWNSLVANTTQNAFGITITWTKPNNYYWYNTAYNIYINGSPGIVYSDSAYTMSDTGSVVFYNSTAHEPDFGNLDAMQEVPINFSVNYVQTNSPFYSLDHSIQYVVTHEGTITKPTTMASWFYWCDELAFVDWLDFYMQNCTNMSRAFYQCQGYRDYPVTGPAVTTLYQAYYNCIRMTGDAVCGDKVTNMYYTYYNCTNLNGSPTCGPNVTNMAYTYYNCRNLIGMANIGQNVVNAMAAYQNCRKLSYPDCGGDKVTTLAYAYKDCWNLGTGLASISDAIGASVTNMYQTFYNCTSLPKQTRFYITSKNIVNMTNCFSTTNSTNLTLLVPQGTTTMTCAKYANTYGKASITWTNYASYYPGYASAVRNALYNITVVGYQTTA